MSDKEQKITIGQGQFLLQMAAVAQIPDKLGEHSFTPTDRAIIQGMLAGLFKTLKSYSPFAQEYEPGKKSKLFFGDKNDWEKDPKSDNFWHIKDPQRLLKVRLSKEDLNAVAWCGFIAAVPRAAQGENAAGSAVSPSELADTVFPLLRAVGKYNSVADQLGMKKYEDKKHGWNDDPIEELPALPEPTEAK